MKIEIKNLKRCEFASQETHCFEASLYVDGKRFCVVSNEGHGGSDSYYPIDGMNYKDLYRQIEAINNELGKEKVGECYGAELYNNLEIEVGRLINEKLQDEKIKSLLRKICYTDGNNIFSLPSTIKPTENNFDLIKKADWWKPEYKILNEMSMEEIKRQPFFNESRHCDHALEPDDDSARMGR